MDDTIRTTDTDFKGYNPYISYTTDTDFKGYNPYIPYTSEMMNDTTCGVGTDAKDVYEFEIGSPVIDNYVFDRYTLTTDENGMMNMEKKPESNKEYPYSFTDKSGNEFTIYQNKDKSLRVEQSSKTTTTKNHLWKYNENKILKEVEDYVTSTYGSHYCGSNEDYKDIQTIDLMAAKDLAANFCQANILKYGSRYGQKNGRNKRDLMKVIHYAMLLLHFDGHYSRQNNGLSEFR